MGSTPAGVIGRLPLPACPAVPKPRLAGPTAAPIRRVPHVRTPRYVSAGASQAFVRCIGDYRDFRLSQPAAGLFCAAVRHPVQNTLAPAGWSQPPPICRTLFQVVKDRSAYRHDGQRTKREVNVNPFPAPITVERRAYYAHLHAACIISPHCPVTMPGCHTRAHWRASSAGRSANAPPPSSRWTRTEVIVE